MKVLVVYYSRTGYTRRVAEEIAAQCGASIEAIRDDTPRSGIAGYWRCALESLRAAEPPIAAAALDPASYDLVVLGTPVWAGKISSPVRSYVRAHAGQWARVALFCTQGGSGGPKALAALGLLCGRQPVATLVLDDRTIDRGGHAEPLRQFVAAFGSGAR